VSTDIEYLERYADAGNLFAQLCDEMGLDLGAEVDFEILQELAACGDVVTEATAEENRWAYDLQFGANWTLEWLIEHKHMRIAFKAMSGGVGLTTYTREMASVLNAVVEEPRSLLGLTDEAPSVVELMRELSHTREMEAVRERDDTWSVDVDNVKRTLDLNIGLENGHE
jgi:hypothetical protein